MPAGGITGMAANPDSHVAYCCATWQACLPASLPNPSMRAVKAASQGAYAELHADVAAGLLRCKSVACGAPFSSFWLRLLGLRRWA